MAGLSGPLPGPQESEDKEMGRSLLVVRERTALLLQEDALAQWRQLENDPQLQLSELLSASAASLALDAQGVGIETAFGLQYEADLERPVTHPETGQSVSQYSARMLFAGLSGPAGTRVGLIYGDSYPTAEAAASGQGGQIRSLIAPEGGDWQRAEEHAFDQGNLVPADGFWDAFKRCLGGCGSTCLASLTGCLVLGALPAIVGCLAATCGACAAKCAACALCDCGWLCRPIVGCCEQ
ncbi:hypothetical protein GTU99_07335 [Streptomyces sp. PRKS01-65]|nr:hypothetical protein [Streptomyces harenosi]NEY32013.1 hypothetical protein [Streptomyces harenosi]